MNTKVYMIRIIFKWVFYLILCGIFFAHSFKAIYSALDLLYSSLGRYLLFDK